MTSLSPGHKSSTVAERVASRLHAVRQKNVLQLVRPIFISCFAIMNSLCSSNSHSNSFLLILSLAFPPAVAFTNFLSYWKCFLWLPSSNWSTLSLLFLCLLLALRPDLSLKLFHLEGSLPCFTPLAAFSIFSSHFFHNSLTCLSF